MTTYKTMIAQPVAFYKSYIAQHRLICEAYHVKLMKSMMDYQLMTHSLRIIYLYYFLNK